MNKGNLYLIPSLLSTESDINQISTYNLKIIHNLTEFIVEEERTARRFIKTTAYPHPINLIKFHILNEHTKSEQITHYLDTPDKGGNIGLLSEAGCPCIADPGALIVKLAHKKNINVIPLIGPSSIILALMASGFNGQNFTFLGYLPVKAIERTAKIKQIYSDIYKTGQSFIFIETPYRNNHLLDDLIQSLPDDIYLCIAIDLTLKTEKIISKPISYWRKNKPNLNKRPAVFLLSNLNFS
ncbi:MAG: SAM-dependent methyltransferase [Bacteroidales bacterium]|nr:SAM-dependent methyltransferase [Bacteroidales bacterium]